MPDQHGFRHTAGSVPADIACDLPAPGRVADVDGVRQIELLRQFREIIGIGIQVIPCPSP
jgi:hypothetical protein